MKYEKSCGAIIFAEDKVFLIKQTTGDWTFPKGHVEANESEIETAIREVKEETNLNIEIDSTKRFVISYNPKENVIKDVVYFVAKLKDFSLVKLQKEEVIEGEFVPINLVKDRLSHNNLKKLWLEVLEKMAN